VRAGTKVGRSASPRPGRPLLAPKTLRLGGFGFYWTRRPKREDPQVGTPQKAAGRPDQGSAGQAPGGVAQEVDSGPTLGLAGPILHRLCRNLAGMQSRGQVEPQEAKSKSVRGKTWPAATHMPGRTILPPIGLKLGGSIKGRTRGGSRTQPSVGGHSKVPAWASMWPAG
jgi:hypothetical protein